MPQITITNNGEPVVPATTTYADDVTVEADNGVGSVNLGSIQNNGNIDQTLEVDLTNLTNATFTDVAIDNPATGGVSFSSTLPATMVVPPGAQIGVKFTFALDEPAPGGQNPDATADFTAAWAV
jgi:hypothetical protein